ncbi:MAG TPA: hypothetical protein DCR66_11260 [Pseudomonas sp.]|nr:hypothetical protein [Pseudomonas sp.]
MILPLKRYAQFEGRANRREYWMYQLFLFLVATAVMLLAGVLAILIAALSRNLLATIAGGLLSFFLLRWAFGQLPL